MNEIEFLNLMMKRKADPMWSKLQYVQNFIRPKKINYDLIKVN